MAVDPTDFLFEKSFFGGFSVARFLDFLLRFPVIYMPVPFLAFPCLFAQKKYMLVHAGYTRRKRKTPKNAHHHSF